MIGRGLSDQLKTNLGIKAVGNQRRSIRQGWLSALAALAMLIVTGAAQAAPVVQDIEFSSRPGHPDRYEII